jgi:hypothetical protein
MKIHNITNGKSWGLRVSYFKYTQNLIKNSLFSSNKTYKIANKPTKSMKNAETVRARTLS